MIKVLTNVLNYSDKSWVRIIHPDLQSQNHITMRALPQKVFLKTKQAALVGQPA
jgi:hypothetical protein